MHDSSNATRTTRWFAALQRRTAATVAAVAVVTALLAIPFLTMAPDRSASTEPAGPVFDARDRIDETFVSTVRGIGVVADDPDGDILRADPLRELGAAQERLRSDPDLGPTLFEYFEVDVQREVFGVLSLADLVDDELRATGFAGGLADADDAQVKAAGGVLIDRLGERSDLLGLSAQSRQADDGTWIVPAVNLVVLADDTVLGFGNTSVTLGSDTDSEEYDREVQEVLRTADGLQINGVAIDVNLTSQEQGAVAGPFIGFTILAVLLLVGLTFRSYWVLAVVSASFLALIVWLKGISNLVGLEDDLVLSLIVPVAMISFGVDFAFHALGRYREERAQGRPAGPAFVTGLTAVSAALVLALTSDSTAFLANLTSDIESIDQFGIGAAIALASAFVLLGIVTPLVVSAIEGSVAPPTPGRRSSLLRIGASVGAAAMTMGSVLLMVFLLPWLGAILAVLTILTTLVVPVILRRRGVEGPTVGDTQVDAGTSTLASSIGAAVAAIARRPAVALGAAVVITGVAATFAVRVPAEFDVEDFFASDTDFVVGLDQLDEHTGDRGGEPARVYIEGDLTDPDALATIAAAAEQMRSLDTPSLARDDDGRVEVDGGIFSVFDATWDSPSMVELVAEQTGVTITDVDADTIPDDREQIAALIGVASQTGVPFDGDQLIMTPDEVNTSVSLDGDVASTVLDLEISDSRSQESVALAAADLDPIAEQLSADLGGTFVQITGSPFVREASLDAVSDALQVSLPVALVLCLLVSAIFLRSIRYGLASIAPILMVVAWLYAFMEIAGYSINLVTATIAAVSIGIGIDFAIHYIARYREELERHGLRSVAVRIAGEGTGLALVASAISSAVGFGILALAPMPLFAAYGLLTALMIMLALVATLAVLPSLLVVITRDAEITVADVVAGGEQSSEPITV